MPLRVRNPIPRLLGLVAVVALCAVLITAAAYATPRPAHRSVRIAAAAPTASEKVSLMSPAQRRATLHAVRQMQVQNALRLAAVKGALAEIRVRAVAYWGLEFQRLELIATAKEEAARRAAAALAHIPTPTAVAAAPAAVPAGECWALLAKYFGDALDWAIHVVQRESHCSAATNWHEGCASDGSHAMGPWQMCYPLHEPTFAAVGCSGRPLDLECNMKAARALYEGSGRAPWGG